MTLLYGTYDSKSGYSTYTVPQQVHEPYGSIPGEVLDVRPYFIAFVPDSGQNEILLATYAIPDESPAEEFTCRACQPFIGEALLKKGASGWTVEASRIPDIADGTSGEPPDAELFKFGPQLTGIRFTLTVQHQGDEGTSITLLVPWAGGFSEAFSGEIEGNNSAECGPDAGMMDCFRFHSNLTFVRGENPDYYDLVVKTSGTDWNGLSPRGVKNVSGVKHLHFVDGKYVPANSQLKNRL